MALVYNAALPEKRRRPCDHRVGLALVDLERVQRRPGNASGQVGPVDVAVPWCPVVENAIDIVEMTADRPRREAREPVMTVDEAQAVQDLGVADVVPVADDLVR